MRKAVSARRCRLQQQHSPIIARFRQVDVASEKTVADVLGFARAQFGRLPIVFNNAGVGGAIGPLTETTEADWDYTLALLAKACSSALHTRQGFSASSVTAARSSIALRLPCSVGMVGR
jgi:NAD(P)-dependent dehydrogenase (short-subunit alcohol dehydrogenase family)